MIEPIWLLAATAVFAGLANADRTQFEPRALNAESPLRQRGADAPQAKSPPFYPAPWMNPNADGWESAYIQAKQFVSQLTLLEKVNLTTGVGWQGEQCVGQIGSVPRLGLTSMCMQDSPVGVRDTDFNSVFTSGQTAAATFDRALLYARGLAMGQEHKGKGVTVQLGPVAGPLGRAPEGGRNWEGFAPDPVLTGVSIAETIRGIQDAGVIACAKHFIGNEQEHFRQAGEAQGYGYNITESLSSNIDDKTMHEIYLWPFADAVRAGVGSVMCSYNQINNSYGCQNSKMLNNLLKGELGFQGFVMTDWQAQHSGVSSALAGLDMTMPGDTVFNSAVSYWGTNLTLAVINGTIPEWRIDDMAMRIMAAFFKVGNTIGSQVPINFDSWTLDTYGPVHWAAGVGQQQINHHVDVRGDHAALIREIAAKGTVLLKNTNNALPLNKPKFLVVVGDDAGPNPDGPNGCSDRGCDNGTLAMAWGSGSANFPYLVTPDAALQAKAISDGTVYESILANNRPDTTNALVSQDGVTAIVFVNADSGEGYINVGGNEGDRLNLTLWHDGDALIKNVSSLCNNTIVVIHSTGPVLVEEWYDSPNVTAIVWAGVPGQESGNSLVDVLYGAVNPAGRTPFTWGTTRESYGVDVTYEPSGEVPQVDFTEGIFIDYRSFDKYNKTPRYEFGYGLSYTTFSYANLDVQKVPAAPYKPTTGYTKPAPTIGTGKTSTNLADYLFPNATLSHVWQYIYPYLNTSSSGKAASGDANYGQPSDTYLPPGATDQSPQPYLAAGDKIASGGNAGLYDVLYTVTAQVTNTGSVTGDEVPQLYVSLGGPDDAPVALRGFDRLHALAPGQTGIFNAALTRRDLSNWDTTTQDWVISNYTKTVYVGSSSRKLPLSATLD
ncbi:beta-glucosidase [Sporothrix brasiliensis 5110]|uniref:beta-glucosidase n=1 Tax=Sporothrix brasiliensis 5110 TaxID=1398154 RepID=A0A0C2IR07_9PEZI|nr:beta-glucosidase [Sporothrix brasiliensis 5110]KIH89315.1 beta-glucosidase [Sporothrix brasiliensis 5110]